MKNNTIVVKFKNKNSRPLVAIKAKQATVKSYKVRVLMTDEQIFEQYNQTQAKPYDNEQLEIKLINFSEGTAIISLDNLKDKNISKFLKNKDIEIVTQFGIYDNPFEPNKAYCIYGFSIVRCNSVDVAMINKFMEKF